MTDPFEAASAAKREASLAGLLDELVEFVRSYVVMSEAQATACAVWIVHTWAADAAEATPYLSVESAEKRSGKTRLLEVMELLVAGPLPYSSASLAAVFRSLGEPPTTFLMDEVDAIFGPKASPNHEDLRALLNSGYRPGHPVLRCVGEGSKQRVESFPVYCPKALAGIGKLPETLRDRSIPIQLKRRSPSEQVKRFRRREARAAAEPLRERLQEFGAEQVDALAEARPELPAELDDRSQDGWEPLLAIADLAGEGWPVRARAAARELAGAKAEDDSPGVRLLADCRGAFHGHDRLASEALVAALAADEEAPWGNYKGGGKTITQRQLAGLLRKYGIRSGDVWIDGRSAKGYKREDFADAWGRYVPLSPQDQVGDPREAREPAPQAGYSPRGSLAEEVAQEATREGSNPHEQTVLADLADRGGDTGAKEPKPAFTGSEPGADTEGLAERQPDENGDIPCERPAPHRRRGG